MIQLMDVSNQIWLFHPFFSFLLPVFLSNKKAPVTKKGINLSSKILFSHFSGVILGQKLLSGQSYNVFFSPQISIPRQETLRLTYFWTSKHTVFFLTEQHTGEPNFDCELGDIKWYMLRETYMFCWASDSLKSWREQLYCHVTAAAIPRRIRLSDVTFSFCEPQTRLILMWLGWTERGKSVRCCHLGMCWKHSCWLHMCRKRMSGMCR